MGPLLRFVALMTKCLGNPSTMHRSQDTRSDVIRFVQTGSYPLRGGNKLRSLICQLASNNDQGMLESLGI